MKELLEKLMNKKITPKECKSLLSISDNEELTTLLINEGYNSRVRKPSIINLTSMNYLDIIKYVSMKIKEYINLDDLVDEVYKLWSMNQITGFNYRYFMDSVDKEYDIRFIVKARNLDMY